MKFLRALIASSICVVATQVTRADSIAPEIRAVRESKAVALNHFYVVLDHATFVALRDSEAFRSQFAAVDTGLPKFEAAKPDSQRLYVRGRNTYMELLGPQNPFKEPVGKVGIALGIDESKYTDGVERAWSAALGSDAQRHLVEWKRSQPAVPWYEVVQHPSTADNADVVLWLSVYRPEFLPWLYPARAAGDNSVARAAFLAPQFRSERLLNDVVGLTIALPKPLREQLTRQLQAIGYGQREENGATVLDGAGWRLTLLETTQRRRGLLSIDLVTNRDVAGQRPLPVGPRSLIEFGQGRSAKWSFK